MDITTAIKQRKSVRAFLDKQVDKNLIRDILDTAKHAPSGVNMQPWQTYVLSGEKKESLQIKIEELFDKGIKENMEYNYYPKEWIEPYKSRRKETGLLMYKTLKITREDKEKQIEQWKANYRAFDAPVVIYFFIDKNLEKGSYLDYGMFLQSIMLCAIEKGLATCMQAAHAEYSQTIKKELHVEENKVLLGGMALGYEDTNAIINSYRTNRIDIEKFSTFVE